MSTLLKLLLFFREQTFLVHDGSFIAAVLKIAGYFRATGLISFKKRDGDRCLSSVTIVKL